jgi:hypothetical protein
VNSINPGGSRVEISPKDSLKAILALNSDPRLKVLQFKEPLPFSFFRALNQDFFPLRPEVELRAYGFYGATCDLSFLKELSRVERFRADCLQNAVGLENISALERLVLLGVGIFNLESFNFLNGVSVSLEDLGLSQTKSRKPSLMNLGRFQRLRKLSLGCHSKGIEALVNHPQLEKLFLTSLAPDALAILKSLPKLRDLELALGRMKDLSALKELDRLQKLTLWWVSLLSNVDSLSNLKGLQHLSFEKQSHVASLPSFKDLAQLESVRLIDMKLLTDISGLADAPALKELRHTSSVLKPIDYIPILENKTLEHAWVYFRSKAANVEFDKLCLDRGIPPPERSNH